MKTNQRLDRHKAEGLAGHWVHPDADGRGHILGDPAHKVISPLLARVDEVLEIYKSITAPTLVVEAGTDSLTQWWHGKYTLAEFHERLTRVRSLRTATVQDAGHMLHHDQPEQLARRKSQIQRKSGSQLAEGISNPGHIRKPGNLCG